MQHSMVFVLTATLVIAYIFLTGIMYRQTVTTVEEEIHREADYISKAVQISGTEYLNQMDEVRANTRITWISAEGTVLYDSTEDEHTFENPQESSGKESICKRRGRISVSRIRSDKRCAIMRKRCQTAPYFVYRGQ